MNFFNEWKQCIDNGQDDSYYINSFLFRSISSTFALENSSIKEIKNIIYFLISINRERIIQFIDDKFIKIVNSADVVQFSNFKKATSELTHLLKYEKNGLTFEDIGYMLVGSENKLSREKYGENHAKTAKDFNLVKFNNQRPIIVKNTSLGNFFPFLNADDQQKLLCILSLRNSLIQIFISKSKKGKIYYNDVVSCLSESTRKRRHNNVKYILDLAIKDIDKDYLSNIIF